MDDMFSELLSEMNAEPLRICVGSGMRQFAMRSLAVRRALRHVARANLEGAVMSTAATSRWQLEGLLARTLLNVVTFPVEGRCSTTALRAQLENPPLQLVGAPTFWDQLRQHALQRGGRLPAKQARMQRLDDAQRWIPLKQLACLVAQFESSLGLQASLLTLPIVCELPAHLSLASDAGPGAPCAPAPTPTLVRTPIPWLDSDPPLVMGRAGAWFGRDNVHPSQLVNIQILGGTGSGKTASCVEPPLGALLNYAVDGLQTAMLVIDPKRELEAKVRRVLSQRGELDRLVVIGECAPIRFFAANSPLSTSDRLTKCQAFGPLITPTGDLSFWYQLGMALLRDLLQLQAEFTAKTQGGRLFELMADQLGAARSAQAGSWGQIREFLSWVRRGGMAKLKEASLALEQIVQIAGVHSASINVLKNYTKDDELFRQFSYACQSADPLINALSNPDIGPFVDLDLLPDLRRAHTDIAQLVEAGKVILFCPEARDGHRLAGKALKAKFFEAVFARDNLARPVAYVCDEAQRFITQDAESGEQNFLDRCRAYRAICVLASQSLASIEHELGSDNAACTAMDIISANTPTKLVMRTTDTRTIDWLRTILPPPQTEGPHVVDVRRPSQLRVGEAYSIFADGGWGLHRARLADLS